jgi:hypothetical protein
MELKYKDPEEIRIALGLMPWDEFKKYAQINTISADKDRATGRTTKILIEAVFESQTEPIVEIVGWSNYYTNDLVVRTRDICIRLGLDPRKIQAGNRDTRGSKRKCFIDHADNVKNYA